MNKVRLSIKKIRNYYRFLNALNHYSELSSEYPPYVAIETTAVCNLRCNKCPVGRERTVSPNNNFMEMNLYYKIIDEIKDYCIGVCLSYFGEPLINPRFFEYVKYAKKNGVSVSFYSNGIVLDEKIAREIVRNEVDDIAFSVDCLPQDYKFYAHMKNVSLVVAKGQLESIIRNIHYLLKLIKNTGASTQISVIRMDAPESTPLAVYEKFFKGSKVTILSGGVIDWGGTIDRVEVTRRMKPIVCHYPWEIGVDSSGLVAMCHVDYNAEHKIGDVNYQTIKEIYNGEKVRAIRKMQASSNIKGLPCENCSHEDFSINKGSPLKRILGFICKRYDRFGILNRGQSIWKRMARR